MRALVTGGRYYKNENFVHTMLWTLAPGFLIIGPSAGVDTYARNWAKISGTPFTDYEPIPTIERGKPAPMMWRAGVAAELRMDIVLAFPGAGATHHIVMNALCYSVPVMMISDRLHYCIRDGHGPVDDTVDFC